MRLTHCPHPSQARHGQRRFKFLATPRPDERYLVGGWVRLLFATLAPCLREQDRQCTLSAPDSVPPSITGTAWSAIQSHRSWLQSGQRATRLPCSFLPSSCTLSHALTVSLRRFCCEYVLYSGRRCAVDLACSKGLGLWLGSVQ